MDIQLEKKQTAKKPQEERRERYSKISQSAWILDTKTESERKREGKGEGH